jgi:hypothetical protein
VHPSEALQAFAERRLGAPALLRSLAEYRGFLVASEPNPDGGARPALRPLDGTPTLAVFVDDKALDAAVVHYGPSAIQQAITGVDGAALFAGMPDNVDRVVVNPSAPADLEIQGGDVGSLRKLARAVRVERALADPSDGPALRRFSRDFDGFRLPLIQTAAGLVPMQLNDQKGAPHALVFTAQDCVEAFLATAPSEARSETILWLTLGGIELFTKLPELKVAGVLFNVSGPAPRAAFKIGVCELVTAPGRRARTSLPAPPAAPAAHELTEEQRVLATIVQVAGGARRADFGVTSFATSAHRIYWTGVDGTGIVRRGEVGHGDGDEIGRAKFEQVVSLARALRDADLPSLRVPEGTEPAPPTVPPARLGVRSGDDRLFVEVPASQLDLVPVLADLFRRLQQIADDAAAVKGIPAAPVTPIPPPLDPLAFALEELAAGRAGKLCVRAVFQPDEHRRSELCVLASGDILRREWVDSQSSASEPLGHASQEALQNLARVLLDAGLSRAHPPDEGGGAREFPRVGLGIDLPDSAPFQLELAHARLDTVPPLKTGIDAVYALARASRTT